MTRAVARQLAVQGFAVVPGWFEAAPLSAEFDATMAAAFVDADHLNAGAIGNRFRYVPMMGASTPVSLDLLARLATLAADLTEAEVLPTRAKATTYVGSARWHRDSDLPVRSFGFACYLEPLAGLNI